MRLRTRCALLLVDHGSRRPEANALIVRVVTLVEERLGAESIVECAHMEIASPNVDEGFARCVERGATTVIVHPFMLAPGRHVTDDLPRMLEDAASSHEGVSFRIAGPLGSHPGVVDAVLARVREALGENAEAL